jgi:hypothetical protein
METNDNLENETFESHEIIDMNDLIKEAFQMHLNEQREAQNKLSEKVMTALAVKGVKTTKDDIISLTNDLDIQINRNGNKKK